MDPLNTLWLAPVGSAMAPLFRTNRAARRCDRREVCRVAPEAAARRGDGTYLSPGGCTVCFAAALILLVSYDR